MPDVMLVDDERLVARLYARAIEAAGGHAVLFEDGASAFEAIVAQPPALLITDLNMPGLSGLELVERLYARDLKCFPVVLMSADDNMALLQAGVDAGVDDFFVKGIPFQRFMARMQHWLTSPLHGVPAHVRAATSDSLIRAPLGDAPMQRLHDGLDRFVGRTALVVEDMLSLAPADFGRTDSDLLRLLGVIDGTLALLARSNGLAQLRRVEAVAGVLAELPEALAARAATHLPDYGDVAAEATFRHAAQTLVLRP